MTSACCCGTTRIALRDDDEGDDEQRDREQRRAEPHGQGLQLPVFIDVRRTHAAGLRSDSTRRWPRVADDVHRLGARRVRRRELGIPVGAAIGDARGAVGFQAARGPPAPRRASGCGGGGARASRQRCATIVSTTPSTPATANCTGIAGAQPRGDAAQRDGDADRQQVERAGDELGADQHRRRDPPDPVDAHCLVLPVSRIDDQG